jgi:hypothetical protein
MVWVVSGSLGKFQEVVNGANHGPFRSYFLNPAEQELLEPPLLP